MLRFSGLAICSILVAGTLAAGPVESATLAAMRLTETTNYAWATSVEDDAGNYFKRGKHVQEGYTWVELPMLETISRRLGREAGAELEAIFKGDDCVIRLGENWKTVKQLPRAAPELEELCFVLPPGASAPSMSDPFPPIIVLTPRREPQEEKPFSNARLAASPPHEELALIVSSWERVAVEEDTVRGVLTDTGARLLLCPGANLDSAPLAAAGQFTLWIKDDRVVRYSVKLEGVLQVGKKKMLVRQSADTTISEVGSASFFLADEARVKLGN